MTVRPGRNFRDAGLGVCSVSMNMSLLQAMPPALVISQGAGLAIPTEHGSSAPCLQPQKYSGHWRLDEAPRHSDDRGPMNMVPPFADPPPALAPADWLLQVGRLAQSADELLGGLCDLLVARGLPLERVGLHGRVLHPQLAGVRLLWRRGIGAEETLYAHDTVDSGAYEKSPLYQVYHTGNIVRRRLNGASADDDFPILAELRTEG